VRGHVHRGGPHKRGLGRRWKLETASKSGHDGARDLVLDREDIAELSVVFVGPDLVPIFRVHEPRADSDPIRCRPDTALDQHRDVQCFANGGRTEVRMLQRERRGARNDAQPVDFAQCRVQLFRHSIREVLVLSIITQVCERENGDRRHGRAHACVVRRLSA
jgi:hypothetical protein